MLEFTKHVLAFYLFVCLPGLVTSFCFNKSTMFFSALICVSFKCKLEKPAVPCSCESVEPRCLKTTISNLHSTLLLIAIIIIINIANKGCLFTFLKNLLKRP